MRCPGVLGGLVCLGMAVGSAAGRADDTQPAAAEYDTARARFGTGSEAEVKLALWCEAHGLTAERLKHLVRAVLADPNNRTARGLLGFIADERGKWRRPEEVAARERVSAALAEYNARREKTPETADAQWKLALWCEQKGLKPEAVAHLTAVTRLDPQRALAWKHLGYRPHRGRWIIEQELRDEIAEKKAQDQANRKWAETLVRLKTAWKSKDAARCAEAESALAGVTDPRAVPAVMGVFGTGDARAQRVAVGVLGRIESPASSRALAGLSAGSPSEAVRRAAAETLRRRDPRDFVGPLIALLGEPITYRLKPVQPDGQAGDLFIEGEKFNLDRVYQPPAPLNVPVTPGSFLDRDANGSPVLWLASALRQGTAFASNFQPVLTTILARTPVRSIADQGRLIASLFGDNGGLAALPFRMRPRFDTVFSAELPAGHAAVPIGAMAAEIDRANYELRGQQRDDARTLDRRNTAVLKANDPVVLTLQAALGFSPGPKRSDWERWWNDQRGYVLASKSSTVKPTMIESVTSDYNPRPIGQYQFDPQVGYFLPRRDCFAAGTSVRTLDGPRPIESVQRGDRVLAQDPKTGSLSYQPVLTVYHNPPGETLRMVLDGETVLTTSIQRFWKARQGWVMARDLAPGDTVRTLGGLARVDSVTPDVARPVYNLEVAAARDFFVGIAGLLVHDHTPVDAVTEPFDATLP